MMKSLVLLTMTLWLWCVSGTALAAPSPPVMAYSTTGLSITASWTTVPGATGYTLFYAPYPFIGPETIGSIDMGTETSVSFYLWEGAAFFVAVQAYDAEGSSEYSNIDYFIMGPPTPEWVDDDGDGYHENAGDCDDGNAAIHPTATEVCGNGIDEDCSGADLPCDPVEVDSDGDGYTAAQGDCNDSNPAIRPGIAETCGDDIDMNCDGEKRCEDEIDNDGDGYSELQGDCDDSRFGINPGAVDICNDGIDQDCSGGEPVCAETVAAPEFSPTGGTFTFGQLVTISTATPGAQIRYTTNGATPTRTSPVYGGTLPVNSSQTIKAVAYRSGLNPSAVFSGSYTINPSLTGTWAVTHTTGFNTCNQAIGEVIQFNADVVQTGSNVTVTTQAGTGTGTIQGNQGTWTTSQPVSNGSLSGTLTFTMNVRINADWKGFNGPTNFTFSSSSLGCSGSGTISGMRVL